MTFSPEPDPFQVPNPRTTAQGGSPPWEPPTEHVVTMTQEAADAIREHAKNEYALSQPDLLNYLYYEYNPAASCGEFKDSRTGARAHLTIFGETSDIINRLGPYGNKGDTNYNNDVRTAKWVMGLVCPEGAPNDIVYLFQVQCSNMQKLKQRTEGDPEDGPPHNKGYKVYNCVKPIAISNTYALAVTANSNILPKVAAAKKQAMPEFDPKLLKQGKPVTPASVRDSQGEPSTFAVANRARNENLYLEKNDQVYVSDLVDDLNKYSAIMSDAVRSTTRICDANYRNNEGKVYSPVHYSTAFSSGKLVEGNITIKVWDYSKSLNGASKTYQIASRSIIKIPAPPAAQSDGPATLMANAANEKRKQVPLQPAYNASAGSSTDMAGVEVPEMTLLPDSDEEADDGHMVKKTKTNEKIKKAAKASNKKN